MERYVLFRFKNNVLPLTSLFVTESNEEIKCNWAFPWENDMTFENVLEQTKQYDFFEIVWAGKCKFHKKLW